MSIDVAWGNRVAANITPDSETDIGKWTDEQIIAALSHGVGKDGTQLSPIMPRPYFQAMKAEDLRAIVVWLGHRKSALNSALADLDSCSRRQA